MTKERRSVGTFDPREKMDSANDFELDRDEEISSAAANRSTCIHVAEGKEKEWRQPSLQGTACRTSPGQLAVRSSTHARTKEVRSFCILSSCPIVVFLALINLVYSLLSYVTVSAEKPRDRSRPASSAFTASDLPRN